MGFEQVEQSRGVVGGGKKKRERETETEVQTLHLLFLKEALSHRGELSLWKYGISIHGPGDALVPVLMILQAAVRLGWQILAYHMQSSEFISSVT